MWRREQVTPDQCRAARELLNWSQDDLAQISRVPVEIVAMFEDGKLAGIADCQIAMHEALGPAWHWPTVAVSRKLAAV
jgi:ribosome-binding protein aMBF1 (putative translation factor)